MQVFKYYFKIASTMRRSLLIYVGISAAMMASLTVQLQQTNNTSSYSDTKPNVAIINRDSSTFSSGFVDYMDDVSKPVTVENSETAQKDALYYETADAIIVIPNGFGDNFFAGDDVQIDVQTSTGQSGAQSSELAANYLRLSHVRASAGMSQQETIDGVKDDLTHTASIETLGNTQTASEASYLEAFTNIAAYPILALDIAIISQIMLAFNGRWIRRRNQVSALSSTSLTRQLILANAIFTVGVWAALVITALILYPDVMATTASILYATSLLMFSFVALGVGFLLGLVLKNRRSIGAISNVIVLGMCFLGGVFVSRSLLSAEVVSFSKVLPIYWFVEANTKIGGLTSYDWGALQLIIVDWGVILGFAIAIFAVSFAIARRRTQ